MSKEFLKYPSISSERAWTKQVKSNLCTREFSGLVDGKPTFVESYPVIEMIGTTKLHGTHGDVIVWEDGDVTIQSRNRIVTCMDDNQGFANFVHSIGLSLFMEYASKFIGGHRAVMISFEYAGGNIQAGVAVNGLEKFLMCIGVCTIDNIDMDDNKRNKINIDHNHWMDNPDNKIYTATRFGVWHEIIDFDPVDGNFAKFFGDRVPEIIDDVENHCPVGKYFEIDGIGEGVVFRPIDDKLQSSKYVLKIKGEKHRVGGADKCEKIRTIITPEMNENINSLIGKVIHEGRLRQGIEYMNEFNIPLDMPHMKEFMKWINGDVRKEHEHDFADHNLAFRDITKPMSKIIVTWYKEYIFS